MKLSHVLLGTLFISTTAVAGNNQTCSGLKVENTVCQSSVEGTDTTNDKGDRIARRNRRRNKRHNKRFAGSCGLG